jgi:probable O-glycosylation ligase (exosortase A-associated)
MRECWVIRPEEDIFKPTSGFGAEIRRELLASPWRTGILLGIALLLGILLAYNPLLCLAVIFAGSVIILTLVSPYAGVLIMLLFIFFRPAERFPALEQLHLARLQVLLVIAAWLLEIILRKRRPFLRHPIIFGFYAGAIAIGLSITTALWKQAAFSYLGNYLFALIPLVITIDLVNSEKRLKGYVAVLLLVAAWSIGEQLRGVGAAMVTPEGVARAGSVGTFLTDSNDFALAMLVFLPFAAYTMLTAKNRGARFFAGALSLALIWSVITTGSRGGALALAALFLFAWLKSKRKAAWGIALVVLLAAAWSLSSPAYRERILSISHYQQDEAVTVRTDAWKAGIRMFMRQPAFGVGAFNFATAYARPGYGTERGGKWRAAHSLYIQTLAELGIVGILWLLAMIFLIARAGHRASKNLSPGTGNYGAAIGMAVQLSLLVFLIAGAFLSCLYYPYITQLGILAIAAERLAAKPKPEVEIREEEAVEAQEESFALGMLPR